MRTKVNRMLTFDHNANKDYKTVISKFRRPELTAVLNMTCVYGVRNPHGLHTHIHTHFSLVFFFQPSNICPRDILGRAKLLPMTPVLSTCHSLVAMSSMTLLMILGNGTLLVRMTDLAEVLIGSIVVFL